MSVRTALVFAAKLGVLTLALFVCFAVAGSIALPAEPQPASPEEASASALALLAVCALDAAVLGFIVLRSRWSGWRLVAAIFVAYYGTMTVMSQIESAVFITRLPAGFLPRLFLMGAIVAGIFSPLAVFVLRWRREVVEDAPSDLGPAHPASEWGLRLAAIAAIYVTLYFTFGYYVAWRVPAVREYYAGGDLTGFAGAMRNMLRDTPWLPAFQALRAMMWTAIALPVVRMTKGAWWEAGLGVALLFSVVMNAQLLLPNPYMPEAVRMAHLVETASSNFLFGWAVAWLLWPLTRAGRAVRGATEARPA